DLKQHQLTNEFLTYTNLIYPQEHSLLDYLSADGVVHIDDWTRIKQTAKEISEEELGWLEDKAKHHQILHAVSLGHDVGQLISRDKHAQDFWALFRKGMGQLRFKVLTDFGSRTMQRFFGQMPLLKTEMQRWLDQGQTVILMATSKERQNQIAQTMDDFGIKVTSTELNHLQQNIVQLVPTNLANGFEIPQMGLVIITEGEMFKQVKKRRIRPQKLANAERIKNYLDLKPGDYVVHVNHGIGIFSGIRTMEVDGVHQDYMVINYRN